MALHLHSPNAVMTPTGTTLPLSMRGIRLEELNIALTLAVRTATQHLAHYKRHLRISLQARCTPRLHCSAPSIRPHDSMLTKQNTHYFH